VVGQEVPRSTTGRVITPGSSSHSNATILRIPSPSNPAQSQVCIISLFDYFSRFVAVLLPIVRITSEYMEVRFFLCMLVLSS